MAQDAVDTTAKEEDGGAATGDEIAKEEDKEKEVGDGGDVRDGGAAAGSSSSASSDERWRRVQESARQVRPPVQGARDGGGGAGGYHGEGGGVGGYRGDARLVVKQKRKAVLSNLLYGRRAAEKLKAASERRRRRRQYRTLVGAAAATKGDDGAAGGLPRRRSWLYTLLNPRSSRPQAVFFKRFMATVIVVDLGFFVCSTEPMWEDLPIFHYAEGVTSSIFLVEYLSRIVTCTESEKFRPHGPLWGRVRYVLTVPAIVDALATFPFFVDQYFGMDLPTLTYLRVFRLLRILKTEGFASAFDSVCRVIYYNSEILYVAAMLCIFLVLFTAVAMYYLRPPQFQDDVVAAAADGGTGGGASRWRKWGGGAAEEQQPQPQQQQSIPDSADFRSVAATMYLTTLMLTGQGGPEGDLPWYTQAIVLLTGIFSVAMFAIPASMLTWGFEAEAERMAHRAVKRSVLKRKKKHLSGDDVWSSTLEDSEEGDAYASSSSMDSSDDEYEKIIGGDDDDDDDYGGDKDGDGDGGGGNGKSERDPEKARALRELLDVFARADDDGSGTLTKQEFVRMAEALLETAASASAAASERTAAAFSASSGAAATAAASASTGAVSTSATAARAVAATGNPSGTAAATTTSTPPPATSEVAVLSARVARLEAKVDAQTSKLDELIRMSEKPADRAFRDPFP